MTEITLSSTGASGLVNLPSVPHTAVQSGPTVRVSPPHPRVWVAGMALAAALATSTFVGIPSQETAPLAEQTFSPLLTFPDTEDQGTVISANYPTEKSLEASDLVRFIHDESGLTWDQIARVLGVSRRSIHLWASGSKINARNTEMLVDLSDVVRGAAALPQSQRRAWLYASTPGEPSPLESFQGRHRRTQTPIVAVGYTPSQLAGAESD